MTAHDRNEDDPEPQPLDYWVPPQEEPIGPPETDPSYQWFSYIAVLISVTAMLVGLLLMAVLAYLLFRPMF